MTVATWRNPQRQAADGKASVWVGASAGTGKTKVLTDRVLNLLLEGAPPQRILCLTFTRAAAAEMANRINKRLAEWTQCATPRLEGELAELLDRPVRAADIDTARRLFARVLDTPGGMRIETIHAFCQSLLRRFPLEAGVVPHFEVMDERSAAEMLRSAQETVLAAAKGGAQPELAAALAEVTLHAPEQGFAGLMGELAVERGRLRRLFEGGDNLGGYLGELRTRLGLKPDEDADAVLEAAVAESAFDGAALRAAAAAMLSDGSGAERERAQCIADWLAAAERRHDGFDRYVKAFLTAKGEKRATVATKAVVRKNPGIETALAAEAARVMAVVERRKAALLFAANAALLRLAAALIAAYDRMKVLHARLDYDDLVLKSAELLARPGVAPWVLFRLDGGLDHILIDEAQDTNPDQWGVVRHLADEFFAGAGARAVARTVFAVGDVKQSIYSFQRADPAEFARMRGYFEGRVRGVGALWRRVDLARSFRSTPSVLAAVDAVFARDAARAGVALEGEAIRHEAVRRGCAGRVEVWPPVEPEETPAPASWEEPVRQQRQRDPQQRLAQAIAGTIRRWLDAGETLPARGRAVRAGDVLVLVRRRTAFVPALVRALKAKDIGVAGADRLVLTEQLAVQDLVALGEALLLPEDDLVLASVLKGPLIGFDDDQLFALAHGRPGRLWRALLERREENPAFARAAAYLEGLRDRTDFVPPYELFAEILGPRGGRRALLARLGPDAADPIDAFLGLALAYDRQHVPSLQGFLHWLATGDTELKRDSDAGVGEEVRIMTVHGAKGLQAPIVFLPDTLQPPTETPRLLWRDDRPLWLPRSALEEAMSAAAKREAIRRRDEEYRRLLYVAMTRAEDRLYICGWGRANPNHGCWYNLIAAGLADLAQPHAFDFTDVAGTDGWSGPGLVHANPQTADPETHDRTVAAPAGDSAVPGWVSSPAPAEPSPPRPLAPSRPAFADPPARSPLVEGGGAAYRRGLLVHRLLQALPAVPAAAQERAARRFLAQPGHRLDAAQRDAIAAEVMAVLRHPDFAPLFGPGSSAEVPVVGLVNGFALVGQIDRLVVAADEVLIVDFKTLRPAPLDESQVPEGYLRQLAAYRAALAAIYPRHNLRCALLWTEGPRLMPISLARLAPHAP